MEVDKTACLYAAEGTKVLNGAGHYLEITKDSLFQAEVKNIVQNAIEDILITGRSVDIQSDNVKLGKGIGYQSVVRFDDLKAYLAAAIVAFPGGTGKIVTPLPDNVGSSKTKVSS